MEIYGGLRSGLGRKRRVFISHEVPDFSDEAGQGRCVCSGSYQARSHHPSDHIIPRCSFLLAASQFVPLLPCCTVGEGRPEVSSIKAFHGAILSLSLLSVLFSPLLLRLVTFLWGAFRFLIGVVWVSAKKEVEVSNISNKSFRRKEKNPAYSVRSYQT